MDCFLYFTGSLFNPIPILYIKDDYRKHVQIMLGKIRSEFFRNKGNEELECVEMSPIVGDNIGEENLVVKTENEKALLGINY